MLAIKHLSILGFTLENFTLKQGESTALMGSSGSGKSLCLRAIADLDPNDGVLSFNGVEREAITGPQWRKQVRYLAATPAWWGPYVRDHFSTTMDPQALVDLLAAVLLPKEVLDWPITRLSTGEGQRLALICAVIGSPQILLLDEPTSGLDNKTAAAVERLLLDLANKGLSLIVATHDRAQAKRMSTRLLSIDTKAGKSGIKETRL